MPNGIYLEGEFNLSFELNNQVFTTSESSVLPGAFSFPFELEFTGKNLSQLGNPHLVNNSKNWQTYQGVWVEVYGIPMFYGTLSIQRINPPKISAVIVSNPMSRLKSINLSDLDLGGDRTILGVVHEYMLATANNPENYDFCFFPVENPNNNGFPDLPGDSAGIGEGHQNFFQQFTLSEFSEASGGITPFIRLDYLLSRIFAAETSGFTFENEWQLDEELRRLYVYNNFDSRTLNSSGDPVLPSTFNLKNHVPKIKCSDFLKNVVAQHCLGMFTNVFSQKIRMTPIVDLLNRPTRVDWTKFMIGKLSFDNVDVPPRRFNYSQIEGIPADYPAPYNLKSYPTNEDIGADMPPVGYYYLEASTEIVSWNIPDPGIRNKHFLGVSEGEGEEFNPGMTCMYSKERYYQSTVEVSRWRKIDTDGTISYERIVIDPPVALMWYRGMQVCGGDLIEDVGIMPYASNHVWLPGSGSPSSKNQIVSDGETPFDSTRSLNWFGEYGLYERMHRRWWDLLNTGKHVSVTLALPVAELIAFSFADKVRIESMDYFVKKLRVGRPIGNGCLQVEANLVSVI